jgi:tight adherence protein B
MNPTYFVGMWGDSTGRTLIFSSLGLQLVGAGLLYRLARFA